VGAEFPQVETGYQHIDAAALLMVGQPKRFKVMVTDNLFGDILSDLIAGLVGGIGFVGSANMHPGQVSMFEPVHGSAPDIAGTGKANPLAAVLSAGMLARFLGEDRAADRIERAVGAVLSKLGGTTAATMGHSTAEVGDLVAEALTSYREA
jgi:3-isopropylmalate dehydrogenase